jgi:hypothetical protein
MLRTLSPFPNPQLGFTLERDASPNLQFSWVFAKMRIGSTFFVHKKPSYCLKTVAISVNLSKKKLFPKKTKKLEKTEKTEKQAWKTCHRLGVKIFYHTYTWVADGSEQPVQACGNAYYDTLFYSAKKQRHTINVLVVI